MLAPLSVVGVHVNGSYKKKSGQDRTLLEFDRIDGRVVGGPDGLRRPEDLGDVVLGARGERPRVVQVPADVGDPAGVTAVDERQLCDGSGWPTSVRRRTRTALLGLFWRLLEPDPRQVVDLHPTIRRRRGEDGRHVRRPRELEDIVAVRGEGVQLGFQLSRVPERDRLHRQRDPTRRADAPCPSTR